LRAISRKIEDLDRISRRKVKPFPPRFRPPDGA
jgi:hypothetical protein